LVKDIDKKDLLFVALSIQTGFMLWTGDKKLMEGLKKKGFDLTIGTKQLLKQIKI
jgi:predicted nucleic acid-binding protein